MSRVRGLIPALYHSVLEETDRSIRRPVGVVCLESSKAGSQVKGQHPLPAEASADVGVNAVTQNTCLGTLSALHSGRSALHKPLTLRCGRPTWPKHSGGAPSVVSTPQPVPTSQLLGRQGTPPGVPSSLPGRAHELLL